MAWIVSVIVGALIGWVASLVMRSDQSMGALMNIIVGIVGAVLSRWVFGTVLGIGGAMAAGDVSILGIFWGIVGAAILIGLLRALNIVGSDDSTTIPQ